MLKSILFLLFACGAAAAQINIAEIEPNNSTALADAAGIVVTANTVINGSISTVGDTDVFKVTVANAGVMRFETTDATALDCDTSTTTLRFYNSAGVALYTDNSSGMRSCSLIQIAVQPGTYYIGVEELANNGTIPVYALLVNFVQSGGSESEPNEFIGASSPVGTLPLFVSGTHPVFNDVDFYQVVLTQTASVRFEIIEGDTSETCESNGIDSQITLFNFAGTQLVADDDNGRGLCSAIDGRGTSPQHPAAANLSPGVYYLRVVSSPLASGASAVFNYRVVMQLPGLTPTAASVSVGGRAVAPSGRGLANVIVTLTDSSGNVRRSRTTPFGYFGFDEVEAGQSYVLGGFSKSHVFAPIVIVANDNSTELLLEAAPNF